MKRRPKPKTNKTKSRNIFQKGPCVALSGKSPPPECLIVFMLCLKVSRLSVVVTSFTFLESMPSKSREESTSLNVVSVKEENSVPLLFKPSTRLFRVVIRFAVEPVLSMANPKEPHPD